MSFFGYKPRYIRGTRADIENIKYNNKPAPVKNGKKGFVISSRVDPNGARKINQLDLSVYYDWNPEPIPDVSADLTYTPMIWGESDLSYVATLADQYDTVMGFNEPDLSSQSNLSNAELLTHWPTIEAGGFSRIVSPGFAQNPTTTGGYLATFMQGTPGVYVPKVDVIAMHRYVPPGYFGSVADRVTRFIGILDDTYDLYKLPIWITEVGMNSKTGSYTTDDVILFMQLLTAECDKRPYVERYYWKTNATVDPKGIGNLFDADGKITEVGLAWKALG